MRFLFESLAVSLIIIWSSGCGGSGIDLFKEVQAAISATACVEAGVKLEGGEWSAGFDAQVCLDAKILGLPLPEVCLEASH
jgi:hypothetical protein